MSDTDTNRDYSNHGREGLEMLTFFAPGFIEPTTEEQEQYERAVADLLTLLDTTPDPDGAKMSFGITIGFAFKRGYLAGRAL